MHEFFSVVFVGGLMSMFVCVLQCCVRGCLCVCLVVFIYVCECLCVKMLFCVSMFFL